MIQNEIDELKISLDRKKLDMEVDAKSLESALREAAKFKQTSLMKQYTKEALQGEEQNVDEDRADMLEKKDALKKKVDGLQAQAEAIQKEIKTAQALFAEMDFKCSHAKDLSDEYGNTIDALESEIAQADNDREVQDKLVNYLKDKMADDEQRNKADHKRRRDLTKMLDEHMTKRRKLP